MAEVASPLSPITSTTTTNGEIKRCYTDPSADVTLLSTPEGREFKVQSFWLKANSYYLRQLLDSPSYKSGEPIKVPASTKVLKVYLDLIHVRHLPPKLLHSIRVPLLKLCDEYGSPGIAERALFQAHHVSIEKDPWELFCLASQRENVGLAKSALRAMDESAKVQHGVGELTPELTEGLNLPYLLGLFNAALQPDVGQHHDHPHNHLNGFDNGNGHPAKGFNGYAHSHPHSEVGGGIPWKAIAEKFEPVYPVKG